MNSNSPDPFCKDSFSSSPMSESSRESLSQLIQAFLASEITAFDFDERIDPFRDSSDPVIRHVVDAVWYTTMTAKTTLSVFPNKSGIISNAC